MYENRFYRSWTDPGNSEAFEIRIGESDIFVRSEGDLRDEATLALLEVRGLIENTIAKSDEFLSSLVPIALGDGAPSVIQTMVGAASAWGVGPMASVAGAVAEFVGRRLLDAGSPSVIVENGGDVYALARRSLHFSLYAGEESPFGDKLTFRVDGRDGVGVCTSSGRVGPSLSFGHADAVVAISENTAYADAAATSIANQIKCEEDVDDVLKRMRWRSGLKGLIVCCGDRLGVFGDLEISKR